MAPEIKGDLKLDQANFQSMASGESIVIVEKGKTAFSIENWTVPGIWAGNEPPGFNDNSGSVSRRLAVFQFNKSVRAEDPTLPDRLKSEISAIICKSTQAYLEAVEKYTQRGIWNILPEYFQATRKELQNATNALASFLTDDSITFNSDMYILMSAFKKMFFDWCELSGYRRPQWAPDYYASIFSQRELTTVKDARKVYPRDQGIRVHGTFIIGCDITNSLVYSDNQ